MFKLLLQPISISLILLFLTSTLYAGEYEKIVGQNVYSFSQVDAFGNQFDINDYIGKKMVISIGDKKSDIKKSLWNDWKNLYKFSKDTVFINIYFPGGISFTVPRGEVVHRIRKMINKRKSEILNSVSYEKRKFLNSLDIHWIIDWKRRISGRFHAPRHTIISFFIDKNGIIRDYYTYNENSLDNFFKTVNEFQ